ncbi:hypothetical protein ATE69_13700 [Sphingopyxis sp. H071]|nr:hypothetical protein ATE61_14400 [Sphingopyxis sp. H057]KTE50401.1 hypothetical protein ATE64_16320 [Sphingopyxis sp. H073]KTE52490.1 hypothetical protein ATE69_13700 [Sphingopyxis sp. H071]KTE62983.1 hypothetical protein ATE66_01220 [Sphingopyxis sp. H107]KTE64871.1 hypothetical protein ATE65_10455 [Sphingopyxis sp. H100]KTE72215.1 hypothetical protein ATE60_10450 [Sphingopyxis sp. H081]KTE79746.1 hypothetical protein ATE63_13870 [Sphingopyxis sp. H067]
MLDQRVEDDLLIIEQVFEFVDDEKEALTQKLRQLENRLTEVINRLALQRQRWQSRWIKIVQEGLESAASSMNALEQLGLIVGHIEVKRIGDILTH